MLGVNPVGAGAAKSSRRQLEKPTQVQHFCHAISQGQEHIPGLLPHGHCLMHSPPQRQALGETCWTTACVEAPRALPLPPKDISSPKT